MLKTTMNYGEAYKELHKRKDGKFFRGKVSKWKVVVGLVNRCKPTNMLDYGCGKGDQYKTHGVHDKWGGILPTRYDVGVPEFSQRPVGQFDGILCCDVMEHIAPEDVDAVLADIFSYSSAPRDGGQESFVYLYISVVPSTGKTLPDGRNVHLTVQPPEWWNAKLAKYARDGLVIETRYDTRKIGQVRKNAD